MTCLSRLARLGMLTTVFALSVPSHAAENGWTSLFNGKDLSGWSTWLTMQPPVDNMKVPTSVRGLDTDPLKVVTVVDGMLRVSGEEWGAVSTTGEYENFHLKFDFKWGTKKWAPRLDIARDSGMLYYATGPVGAQDGNWMRSHEFQLQEGFCGDYYSLDHAMVDAHAGDASQGNWKFHRYDASMPLVTDSQARILRQGNYEKPLGEWNTMEIIADGNTLIHVVNGHEVLRMENSRQVVDGKVVPLTRGKFSIQSEGSETFFRNIEIKPLSGPASAEKF